MTDPDPAVLGALSEATAAAESFFDIGHALHSAVPEDSKEAYEAMVYAFRFRLLSPGSEERKVEGCAFGAAWQMDGHRLPPKLRDVPELDVAEWEHVAATAAEPAIRARLHDLLWERRSGDRFVHAREAIRAYVEVSNDQRWRLSDRADAVERAAELAKLIKHAEDQMVVAAAACAVIDADLLDEANGGPGVSLTAIRTLAGLAPEVRGCDMAAQLDRVEGTYGGDPFISDAILDLRTMLDPSVDVGELRENQVREWIERARAGEGILRMVWLQRAHELAIANALSELARDIRRELQEIRPEELDLKEVAYEVRVPEEELQGLIDALVGDDSWQSALIRLGITEAPGGSPTQLEEKVAAHMADHPFLHLIPTNIGAGPYGTTIFQATTHADHLRLNLAQQRALAAQGWSLIAMRVLPRITEQHGRPTRVELSAFFTGNAISEDVAERLARGFELFWDGEHDECVHVVTPRLEAILRSLAFTAGIPLNTIQKGDDPGGVRTLGSVLEELRPFWSDAGWWEYVRNLLTDPLGLNLRNAVCHALRPDFGADDAALLLHLACYLRRINFVAGQDDPSGGKAHPSGPAESSP